ncbi:MAG: hypothetical protein OD918_08890 [Gammaproteobacteria bacterium]
MKHEQYFETFLAEHVNLNQSRLKDLESHVNAIKTFLKGKLGNYKKFSQQGSYAHKTIIKPVKGNDEFDADVLVFIRDDNFSPAKFVDHVADVYDVLAADKNYADKIKKGTRCVTINYANEFHLDIVPCIEHNGICYICNRTENEYEKTDGDGYKDWLSLKNQITGSNNLRKATRLFKFLRDHKDNFSIKSILLTTILGNQVRQGDANSALFCDLPTSLKTISNRVNDFLQGQWSMPIVRNPVLPEEDFNRHWDDKKHANFREKFAAYNARINEAFASKDRDESVKCWRKLFGDDFGKLKYAKPAAVAAGAGAAVAPKFSTGATRPYAHND